MRAAVAEGDISKCSLYGLGIYSQLCSRGSGLTARDMEAGLARPKVDSSKDLYEEQRVRLAWACLPPLGPPAFQAVSTPIIAKPPRYPGHEKNNMDPLSSPYFHDNTAMATSREAPNPLRPYYIPPSIGIPPEATANTASAAAAAPGRTSSSFAKASLGTQARDILGDLDYGDYLSDSSPSMAEMSKKLMDQAIWNYTTVLLSQPFEVARTVLQCHFAGSPGITPPSGYGDGNRSRPSSYASGKYEDVGRPCGILGVEQID